MLFLISKNFFVLSILLFFVKIYLALVLGADIFFTDTTAFKNIFLLFLAIFFLFVNILSPLCYKFSLNILPDKL